MDQVSIAPTSWTASSSSSLPGFLTPLPIGALWGVGPRTQERLEQRGIHTVGDLRRLGEATLVDWFGAHGQHLYRLACADDDRAVIPDRAAKSISNEDTYQEDLVGLEALRRHLLSQSTRVADRLVAEGLRARCVHLKLRDNTFVTETRQCTLPRATDEYREIYGAACRLLAAVETDGRRFRLTGVGVANFHPTSGEALPAAQQLDLLATAAPSHAPNVTPARSAALQAVLSAVRERHGHQALYPADAGEQRRPGTTGAITERLPDHKRGAPKK